MKPKPPLLSTLLLLHLLQPMLAEEDPSPIVLERTVVHDGQTQVTIDRIAPPPLPDTPSVAAQLEADSTPANTTVAPQFLALSCTVYDHEFTELQMTHMGQPYVVSSRLNFHLLEGLAEFVWHGRSYSMFLTVGDESIADSTANRAALISQGLPAEVLPLPPQPPQGVAAERLGFQLISQPSTFSPAILQALTDLHQFTLSQLPSLQAKLDQRIQDSQKPQLPPAVPPANVHIQFWPIESTRYDTTPTVTEEAP